MDGYVEKLSVNTKDKNYEIIIGRNVIKLINETGFLLKDKFAIIVSSGVYSLYNEYISECFKDYKNFDIIQMEDGEVNKNYKYAEKVFNILLEKGYTRNSLIIGIGGGVVGDFAGYIAALYMRGIPVIHFPTTLLAMVDSSIGGKVAVNISAGKNIIGAFHQPEMVISDVSFIDTLPENELKNGLSELLKHAIIGKKELLNILSENNLKSIRESNIVGKFVYLSAQFKSFVVGTDEREGGLRSILNYGHTIGHAIESLMEYKGISHGEAVAIGLKIESEISRRMGWLSDDEISKINMIINRYGLIYNEYSLNADEIIDHMKYDKKNSGGKINFVLLKGIGNPLYNQHVDEQLIRDIISS